MAEFRLSRLSRVDDVFWSNVDDRPGVYLFYKTIRGPVRYVGRSDTSLYNRLRNRPYKYFKYKHTDRDIEAYDWERKSFHDYLDTIENVNHPAKPLGLKNRIRCQFCDW